MDEDWGAKVTYEPRRIYRLLTCPQCRVHFTHESNDQTDKRGIVWFCSGTCQEKWNLSHDKDPTLEQNVPECTRRQQALDKEKRET